MDLVHVGKILNVIGFVTTAFPASVNGLCYFDDICEGRMIYERKKAIVSSIASVIGCGISSAGVVVSNIGSNNNIQEIMKYVSSLSDEELEILSGDLVEANISSASIEELVDRMNLLSENADRFDLAEHRELLKKSVANYLEQLKYSDSEAYNEIIKLFSDGYDDGELARELEKSQLIKKMDL